MKTSRGKSTSAAGKKTITPKTLSRRGLLAGSVAAGTLVVFHGEPAATADGKKTFTILHTNDLHSNFIGLGPASDYTRFTLTTTRPWVDSLVWPR